ncbi:hypothetical protein F5Y10DRAFT_286247 [Nemania abortiva]|nr:hypothetical protein F5Y10DRAFT_286247 [Nemania abortiva]
MAQAAAQSTAPTPRRPTPPAPPTGPSGTSGTGRSSQSRGSPRNLVGRTARPSGPQQNAVDTSPAENKILRSAIFRGVASICGILGLLLAVIFGITQWLGQDKSNAIAKESELITLAFSCSDEKLNQTSICRQFLAKYPNGPPISPRGNIPLEHTTVNLTALRTADTGSSSTTPESALPSTLTPRFFTSSVDCSYGDGIYCGSGSYGGFGYPYEFDHVRGLT